MSAAKAVDTGVQVVTMPELSDRDKVAAFEKRTAQLLLDPAILHVFDFSSTTKIDQSFYRILSVYKKSLEKSGKRLVSIHLRQDLLKEAQSMGMGAAFHPVESLERAKEQLVVKTPKNKPHLDFAVLEPFIEGTINTLKVQANLNIKVEKPYIKMKEESSIAIAGVISTNNPEMPGSIALCFSRDVFLKIYEAMVGERHQEISQESQDAAGEMLNIIYGHAKTRLKKDGYTLDMAIPVVLTGEKVKMQIGERGKSVILPFECEYGKFHIEVYFKNTRS